MMKELRRNIKLEQEWVALFVQRARNHYKEMNTKKFKSKISKYDFFKRNEKSKRRK